MWRWWFGNLDIFVVHLLTEVVLAQQFLAREYDPATLSLSYLTDTSNVTGCHRGPKCKLRAGVACAAHICTFCNFLVTRGLPVTVFYSTCIICAYGMALYWPTLQCVYISFACRYVVPPVSVITTLYNHHRPPGHTQSTTTTIFMGY